MSFRRLKTIPTVELLESRTLSASAFLSNGVLNIVGTGRDDTLSVRKVGDRLSVVGTSIRVGGQLRASVADAAVTEIRVEGRAGKDKIRMSAGITDPPRRRPPAAPATTPSAASRT